MADVPGQNPPTNPQANIDELVKELSRPQGGGTAPVPPAQPAPTTPAVPSAPISRPAPAPAAPKPAPASALAAPSVSAPQTQPREYQSSIRTMSDDVSKLKAGQPLQGVTMPRKVPTAPTMPAPAPAAPKPAPAAPVARPSGPTATLGPSQSSRPAPGLPRIPGQTPPTPQPAALDPKSQFSVPETGGSTGGTSRRPLILLLSILAAAIVLGGGYWYFFIRDSEEVVVQTPTPTITPTPTPVNVRLSDIFPSRAATIALPATGDALQAFLNSYKTNVTPSLGLFSQIAVTDANATIALTPFQLLSRFLINYPADINNLIGSDSAVLVYGQQEAFTSAGKITQAAAGAKRLVFVTELTSPAYGTLQSWEPTMSNDLASLFGITPSKNPDPFLSTDYQGTSVRYKNFTFPDASIDYGILSYQGKSYLIMAGSREAMFAAIDAIRLFSQTVGS